MYHSKTCVRFLFAFHNNSIMYHFRDKVRYWSKTVIFFIIQKHIHKVIYLHSPLNVLKLTQPSTLRGTVK